MRSSIFDVWNSCSEQCSRGGRTEAHDWKKSNSNCHVLEDVVIEVMPHSKRRHHLHYSYDPAMHFGRERHHHRWSRVTSAGKSINQKRKESGAFAYMESTCRLTFLFLLPLPPSFKPCCIVFCHVSPSISKNTPNKSFLTNQIYFDIFLHTLLYCFL